MKFYRRQADEVPGVINRCYFDADHGRVALALARLQDLGEEFPDNAHIAYAEGQIRRDYLGQGLAVRPFFERAHRLAINQRLQTETQWFSTCNLVQLARNEHELRRWVETSISEKGKQQEECVGYAKMIETLDEGVPFHELVLTASEHEAQSRDFGVAAALVELALQAWQGIGASDELGLRKNRSMYLRELDRAASQRRESLGEAFPPDERIALLQAFEELQKALSLDEYDATLWNYGAAWCVLLRRYDEAIRFADRAISLRPHRYPRPYINKAQALWELQRHRDALECAREALRQAESSDLPPDVLEQPRRLIQIYEAGPVSPSLAGLREVIGAITASAKRTSEEELAQFRGGITLDTVVRRMLNHLAVVQTNPFKGYVPMVADLLACFSPETALCVSLETHQRENHVAEYCVSAGIYVAVFAEGVHRRDAARYLCLMTLFLREPNAIRRYYRQAFLATSAAAQGPFNQVDATVREELGRIHPLFPSLIADQEPVTTEECRIAVRDVLSHFEGEPPKIADVSVIPMGGKGCARTLLWSLGVLIGAIAFLWWML